MTVTTRDQHDIEQDVLLLTKLNETAASVAEQIAGVKARLAGDFDAGTHPVAGVKVIVTVPGRLDTKALAADYPITAHPELYAAALDTKAVRAHLAPAVIDEKYTARGAKSVSIR